MAKLSTALGGGLSAEPLAELEGVIERSVDTEGVAGVEEVTTPGACSISIETSKLTVDGTDAVTLANGTLVGMKKYIVVSSGANTPIAVVTPATYAEGTTATLTGEGASVILQWDGTTWHTIGTGLGFTIT